MKSLNNGAVAPVDRMSTTIEGSNLHHKPIGQIQYLDADTPYFKAGILIMSICK